jgi:hypothetical protein
VLGHGSGPAGFLRVGPGRASEHPADPTHTLQLTTDFGDTLPDDGSVRFSVPASVHGDPSPWRHQRRPVGPDLLLRPVGRGAGHDHLDTGRRQWCDVCGQRVDHPPLPSEHPRHWPGCPELARRRALCAVRSESRARSSAGTRRSADRPGLAGSLCTRGRQRRSSGPHDCVSPQEARRLPPMTFDARPDDRGSGDAAAYGLDGCLDAVVEVEFREDAGDVVVDGVRAE